MTTPALCGAGFDHDELRTNDTAWSLLPYVGRQSAYDGEGTVLEMRNCKCRSTLCREIRRDKGAA